MGQKSSQPIISVVIPAYNEEKTIGNTLESLKDQRIDYPFEVIVVDNNSTDSTALIATSYDVKVIPCTKQGMTEARLKGIRTAKADIIVCTDADTEFMSNWLSALTFPLVQDRTLSLTHGLSYFPKTTQFKLRLFSALQTAIRYVVRQTPWMVAGHNLAFRKSLVADLPNFGYDPTMKYYEDTGLAFTLYRLGKKTRFVPEAVCITSPRRREKERIHDHLLRWVQAMSHYLLTRRFPRWVYQEDYKSYR